MPTPKTDDFVAYFNSDRHNRRVEDSTKRNVERLSAIGKDDMLAAFSEAIGMAWAVAHFYRTLGLKHQGAKIFSGLFHWMKRGTD